MVIEVRDYDESWPLAADAACRELRAAVRDVFVAIEHIGSRPGLGGVITHRELGGALR